MTVSAAATMVSVVRKLRRASEWEPDNGVQDHAYARRDRSGA